MSGRSLWPLFLISGAAVGYEIALTRYFAVAKWSEYGYWVISIVMVGFALSGVVVALARGVVARHGAALLRWLPVALILAAAFGYWATAANPFNPLQLQNAATYLPQLGDIALYYVVLLPFFFLTGLYISLSFVLNADRVGVVYGYDLTGAGAGAALVLALMFVLHPFALVPALLVLLAASALFGRWRVALAAVVALAAGEALLLADLRADYNDFKAIYAPLHTPDARQVAEVRSPRGLYALLDDFTERVDTDVSNNAGMLNVPGPPSAFGLYRDGSRIAALPKPGESAAAYAAAELDALPYRLLGSPSVLVVGASGGFAIQHARALGAREVTALEPDPVLRDAVRHGLGPSPAALEARVSAGSPLAVAGSYDLIDLSGDFLDVGEANATAFTAEAVAGYLRALRPGGLVSIPVSIREFPVYAMRVLATVRRALLDS
ncbi:MAG TPA: class I SAM-dependent methyltransferase, partial [Acetobacteraceae bacterium]|nr:class I SAM-dependent methyltransferase [Acetobacteraceae bacterium]